MKTTTKRTLPPARLQRFLGWAQRLFFIAGIFALGYVGFTLLYARLYQVSAKRSLENQIQAEEARPVTEPRPAIKRGGVLGRIGIPRLGVSVAILQGTSARTLRLGVGHIEGTPLPGEAGNSGIAGHRDTFFRELKDVRRDDDVELQTAAGLFHYQVDWAKVVAPDEVSVLAPSPESFLTLVTCYPFYLVGPAPKRFVVRAHRYEPSGRVGEN